MADELPRCAQLRDADEVVALADAGMDFALVAGRFHADIVDRLIEGAAAALTARGAAMDNLELIEVPGAFEIPAAADLCIDAAQFDAIVTLGCVIRGETPHFEHVAGACARGIARLARRAVVPVSYGVLTCDTRAQAERRSMLLADWEHPRDDAGRNVGAEAAVAALEMLEVFADWTGDDDDDDD